MFEELAVFTDIAHMLSVFKGGGKGVSQQTWVMLGGGVDGGDCRNLSLLHWALQSIRVAPST